MIAALAQSGTGVISTQVLQEFYVAVTRKLGVAPPAAPWEKDLDAVMLKMAAERTLATRQQLFLQAQNILSDNLPVIYFAVPRVFVATSSRVTGATPAPVRPPILWNADSVGVAR